MKIKYECSHRICALRHGGCFYLINRIEGGWRPYLHPSLHVLFVQQENDQGRDLKHVLVVKTMLWLIRASEGDRAVRFFLFSFFFLFVGEGTQTHPSPWGKTCRHMLFWIFFFWERQEVKAWRKKTIVYSLFPPSSMELIEEGTNPSPPYYYYYIILVIWFIYFFDCFFHIFVLYK